MKIYIFLYFFLFIEPCLSIRSLLYNKNDNDTIIKNNNDTIIKNNDTNGTIINNNTDINNNSLECNNKTKNLNKINKLNDHNVIYKNNNYDKNIIKIIFDIDYFIKKKKLIIKTKLNNSLYLEVYLNKINNLKDL